MKVFLKILFSQIINLLDKLCYFLPDVFLILAVISFLHGNLFNCVLYAIVYMSTSYAEYMYNKIRTTKEMLGKILNELDQFKNEKFVTIEGLTLFAHLIDERFDELEKRISQKEIVSNEVGTEK
jgi:hypothetical protein